MNQIQKQRTMADTERERGAAMMRDMAEVLIGDPDQHTPFTDRWFCLFAELQTAVYAVRLEGGAVGRRLRHGKPARIIECIESALPLGKPGVWFVKVIS